MREAEGSPARGSTRAGSRPWPGLVRGSIARAEVAHVAFRPRRGSWPRWGPQVPGRVRATPLTDRPFLARPRGGGAGSADRDPGRPPYRLDSRPLDAGVGG